MSPVQPNPIVALIVAASENGVIGRDGVMPWRLPSDLKSFRRLTMGRPVIMGRKTFQSIGKALDGRRNMIVSRNRGFAVPGAEVFSSLEAAISAAGAGEIFVIGGAEIYRAALALAARIYLTRVHATLEGDATFEVPSGEGWKIVSEAPLPRGERDEFACMLVILERPSVLAALAT